MRLYIEAIKLGNISLLKSMSKKMMLLAKAHVVKATKSADIFLFFYGCDVLFLQSAQNISSTVSNWPAQSYSDLSRYSPTVPEYTNFTTLITYL